MVKRTLISLRNLLVKEQNEILGAASMLMALLFISKVTGLIFLTLMSKQFGASQETDLFYLASAIPETITNIVLLGAISGSVIPIFVKVREEKGEQNFIAAFSSMISVGMLFFVILAILAAIFSRQLIPFAIQLVQRNIPLEAAEIDMTVWMMRLLLIPQIILGLSAFISTWLNIYHRFIIPSLAPVFYNIGKILGILIFVPLLGGSIWGIIIGTILGAILHLIIQIPLVYYLRLKFKFKIAFKDEHFRQVLKLGLPRTLSLGAEQIASIVDTLIAFSLSTVTSAALTAFQLAMRLMSFPLNLFGTSFAIASFPSLAKLHIQGKTEEFSTLLLRIFNQIIFLALPITVFFLILRVPVVRLVYGIFGGEFSWHDTLQVAWVLLFFSLGIPLESLRSAIFRAYFAIHNSVIPLISSIFVVVLGIITGILFSNYFSHFNTFTIQDMHFNINYFFSRGTGEAGIGGLALSSSLVFILEFLFLLFILYRKRFILELKPFFKQIAKKFLAAVVMIVVCYAMAKLWEEILDTAKTLQLIVLTLSTFGASFMVYVWTSFILDIEEVQIFVELLLRIFRKLFRRHDHIQQEHVQLNGESQLP